MKRALALALLALLVGCGAQAAQPANTTTVAPGALVMRDIRKDASRYLGCQVPAVFVERTSWAGSQGNVVAVGCGFQITYYVVCQASNQCGFTVAE